MQKIIYLAGGCFWGVQGYFDRVKGVIDSSVGYADSNVENPSYEQVCSGITNAVEAVKVIYDSDVISLACDICSLESACESILSRFFSIIEPFCLNRQGNDIGTQYRSGIYATNKSDLEQVKDFLKKLNALYGRKVATEAKLLSNFYMAENYHQKYLEKHPNGYCHIDIECADKPLNLLNFTH